MRSRSTQNNIQNVTFYTRSSSTQNNIQNVTFYTRRLTNKLVKAQRVVKPDVVDWAQSTN